MPLASDKDESGVLSPSPTAFAPQPVTTVNIVEATYKDVAVDTKQTPISTLMTYVEGSYWTVDYYSQVIDTDSPLTAQQVTVSGAYQQYRRIRGLKIKVTTPLHQQQDAQTKMMESDGAGVVFAGLMPNEGDMFVADIGTGAPIVFRVTASNKKSYFKEAVYEIEYALVGGEQQYLDDLATKTVQDLAFRQDFLSHGQQPVISTEASVAIEEMQATIDRLADQYFQMFFDSEFSTLCVPAQAAPTYDPFMTQFLTEFFTREDSPWVQRIRVLNVSEDVACRQDNFWRALKERDATYLKTGFKKTGLAYAREFTRNPYPGNGVYYSGLGWLIYPKDPKIGVLGLRAEQIKPLVEDVLDEGGAAPVLVDSPDSAQNLMFPPLNYVDPESGLPVTDPVVLLPVLTDDYYVLSGNFYTKNDGQSVLETAVWTYLDGGQLDPVQLKRTAEELFYDWGVLEQFYYGPILLVLMNYYIRAFQEEGSPI